MKRVTDISTIFGIFVAFALVGAAIALGGNGGAAFFDEKSLLIVLCGTLFLVIACYSIGDIWRAKGIIASTVIYTKQDASACAINALEVSEISRKKGFLELQKHKDLTEKNKFFDSGLHMMIDGLSGEDTCKMMQAEISALSERHKTSASILRKAAEIAPAMGLIGTLIGLIQMLGQLDDPSSIGPSMALALLTTLYGAVLAYMVFTPLASKLERNSRAELLVMHIYMEAIRSISKRENPRKLEMVLNTLLPPAERVNYFI